MRVIDQVSGQSDAYDRKYWILNFPILLVFFSISGLPRVQIPESTFFRTFTLRLPTGLWHWIRVSDQVSGQSDAYDKKYWILNFSILLVFFSQKWITEGSNPGVDFFQNFYCEDTSVLVTSRKGVRPSSRPIRCIWQEISDFRISKFCKKVWKITKCQREDSVFVRSNLASPQ